MLFCYFTFPVHKPAYQIVSVLKTQLVHNGTCLATALSGPTINVIVLTFIQLFQFGNKLLPQINIYIGCIWYITFLNLFRSPNIQQEGILVVFQLRNVSKQLMIGQIGVIG